MTAEVVRLRIGNLRNAVLVTGQAYQEPKDALNEFVSNSADEYAEAGLAGARITIHLHRRGRRSLVAISDNGRGMDADRLRQVVRNLFESSKAGDERTVGEKAIGILAFQQLGVRCDMVSRTATVAETHRLTLRRGEAAAELAVERRRPRAEAGTTVYISDLEPEVVRVLTRRKLVEYLRLRRGAALARGDYEIEVIEGAHSELVVPQRPDGVRLQIPARMTLWGRIDFALWVAPRVEGQRRRVAVVGRGGTTVIDDIAEIEDFSGPPWSVDQLAGSITFAPLQQSTGRRAILRDRDVFPVFLDTVKTVEPAVKAAVERINRHVEAESSGRLADEVRRIFARVLRELEELSNPMRTALGDSGGIGALLGQPAHPEPTDATTDPDEELPALRELSDPSSRERREPGDTPEAARASGRFARLPTVAPDPDPGRSRSRFDSSAAIVYYNREHADYLLVKDDETALLDYLTQLVAKEYVVFNNPRAAGADLAEEMVRMLVRLRRHVPRATRRVIHRR